MTQICVVHCRRPLDQCECAKNAMATIWSDLSADQKRLPPEFEKVWSDNVQELYEP